MYIQETDKTLPSYTDKDKMIFGFEWLREPFAPLIWNAPVVYSKITHVFVDKKNDWFSFVVIPRWEDKDE